MIFNNDRLPFQSRSSHGSMPLLRLLFLLIGLSIGRTICRGDTITPHIGYLYPAGARRGTSVIVTIGGQFLRRPQQVIISGEGVKAEIIRYFKPPYKLNREQRNDLLQRLIKVRDQRLTLLSSKERREVIANMAIMRRRPNKRKKQKGKPGRTAAAKSPGNSGDKKSSAVERRFGGRPRADHPLLLGLKEKSLRELLNIACIMLGGNRKKQQNRQLSEMVAVKITVAPNAKPGNRFLRLLTRRGLTQPVVFQIGTLPEVNELEPNNPRRGAPLPRALRLPPLTPPVVINGQIMPGDVDQFQFRARKGENLVVSVSARELIPFLADAVPGWFQAVITIYDRHGNEAAYCDDYRFSPDPALCYHVPEDGIYTLRISDAIFRGREDFVYRLTIAQRPFIRELFPLGGRAGSKVSATAGGWNLPPHKLPLDATPSDALFRHTVYRAGKMVSNQITYAVNSLPEIKERENNNRPAEAQQLQLPLIINGRIDHPGDCDIFRFYGRAGDKVAAEVYARRLDSPLDSSLQLLDADGKVIARNDDFMPMEKYLHKSIIGTMTHYADSYLMATLPQDGEYYIRLTDIRQHGGPAYGYRLRLTPPMPDFVLFATPASLTLRAGIPQPVTLHLLRRDGFDGAVEIRLAPNEKNFVIAGGTIPAGKDSIRMTVTARKNAGSISTLRLIGRAEYRGKTLVHQAIAADNVMQAFLYRHLLPADRLLTYILPQKWQPPPITIANKLPIEIQPGGKAKVDIKVPLGKRVKHLQLALDHPPGGISLGEVVREPERQQVTVTIQAAAKSKIGLTDNLIIEVFRKFINPKNRRERRVTLGYLPAIPIRVVANRETIHRELPAKSSAQP